VARITTGQRTAARVALFLLFMLCVVVAGYSRAGFWGAVSAFFITLGVIVGVTVVAVLLAVATSDGKGGW
jgi:hypothetical protein